MASHEDSVPSAMTTRLYRQSEQERECELQDVRIRKMSENSGLLPIVLSPLYGQLMMSGPSSICLHNWVFFSLPSPKVD
jgi:hypothetical protein